MNELAKMDIERWAPIALTEKSYRILIREAVKEMDLCREVVKAAIRESLRKVHN